MLTEEKKRAVLEKLAQVVSQTTPELAAAGNQVVNRHGKQVAPPPVPKSPPVPKPRRESPPPLAVADSKAAAEARAASSGKPVLFGNTAVLPPAVKRDMVAKQQEKQQQEQQRQAQRRKTEREFDNWNNLRRRPAHASR